MLKTFAATCLIAVASGVERKTIPRELYEILDDIIDEHDHDHHKHPQRHLHHHLSEDGTKSPHDDDREEHREHCKQPELGETPEKENEYLELTLLRLFPTCN